jgi:hypothetical protein
MNTRLFGRVGNSTAVARILRVTALLPLIGLAQHICEAQQPVVVIENNRQVTNSTTLNERIDETRKEYWTERVGYRIVKNNDYPLYTVLKAMAQALQKNPSLDVSTLKTIATDSYRALTEAPSAGLQGPGATGSAISSLISMQNPYVGAAVPVLTEMLTAGLKTQLDSLYANDPDGVRNIFLADGPDGLRNLWIQAQTDPKLRAVFDDLTLKQYGLKLWDIPMVNSDPDLDQRKAALKILGTPTQANLDRVPGELQNLIGQSREEFKQIMAQIKLQEAREASKQQQQARIDAFKAKVADQRAGLYLASTAVGFIDPKLGRTVGTIGEAYAKVAESVGLHQLKQMSTVMVTANFISAGMSLSSLMNSEPSTDQIILEQLAAIRKQIDSFRIEMHKRFDRIDEELNHLYLDMVANFGEVNRNVSKARQGIISLQTQLYRIEDRLGELDRRTQSYAQSLSRQMSDASLSYCLGTVDYVPGFVLTDQDYAKCAVAFTRAGTVISKLDVWGNHAINLSEDSVLVEELKRPLEQNLNFLWEVSSVKFGQRPVPFTMLANPVVWAANSNAYIQLVSRASPILSSDKATGELLQVGRELHDFIQVLGQPTPGTNGGTVTYRLLNRYLNDWRTLEHATTRFEVAYRDRVAKGYDPWGDVNQAKESSTADSWAFSTAPGGVPIDFVAPSIPACAGEAALGDISLATPPRMAKVIPYAFRIARELDLGTVSVCYSSPGWVGQWQQLGHEKWKEFRGKLAIRLRISFTAAAEIDKKLGRVVRAKEREHTKDRSPELTSLLISDVYADGGTDYLVACGAIDNQKGLNLAIARNECEDKRKGGLTAEDLKDGFRTVWQADGGLRAKYVDGAAEQGDKQVLTRDLEQVRALVESAYAGYREDLRLEVAAVMSGGTRDFEQEAEEKIPILEALRNVNGLKALLDAYVGLLLSESSKSDDSIALGLASVTSDQWVFQMKTAKGVRGFAKYPKTDTSRVLATLGIPSRVLSLRKLLDDRLTNGPEPLASIDSTLIALDSLRTLQIASALSKTHPCFSEVAEGNVPELPKVKATIKDSAIITSVRFRIETPQERTQPRLTNVLIGDHTKVFSELVETTTREEKGVVFDILLPGGLSFGQLRNGVIRMCQEYTAPLKEPSAQTITISLLSDGQNPIDYKTWDQVTLPPGSKVGVTLQTASEKSKKSATPGSAIQVRGK